MGDINKEIYDRSYELLEGKLMNVISEEDADDLIDKVLSNSISWYNPDSGKIKLNKRGLFYTPIENDTEFYVRVNTNESEISVVLTKKKKTSKGWRTIKSFIH